MSGFSIDPTAQSCYTNNLEEAKPKNIQEKTAETPIPIIKDTKAAETENSVNKSEVLRIELTLKDFKQSVMDEYNNNNEEKTNFENIEDKFLVKRFSLVIANMSDEEKVKDFSFVLREFQSKPILIAEYIKSIKNKKLAAQCAGHIDYDTLANYKNAEVQIEIVKHMSKENIINYLKEHNAKFEQFYSQNKEIVDRVLDKVSKGENLSDDELRIKNNLDTYKELTIILQIGTAENVIMSDEDKENVQKQINDIVQKYPPAFYDLYVQSLAEFVTKHQENLNLNKDKLTEILDKATDGKFTEAVRKLSEKTAIDENTGGFKNNVKSDNIKTASENALKIKEIIKPKENNKDFIVEKNSTKETDIIKNSSKTESFFEKYSREFTKNLITGKIKTYSSTEETIAIDNYKRMDFAQQGKLLQSSIGKFLDKLIENTKTYTLENLLASGWKGATFNITKDVEETVKDRKNKLKPNSLPA